MSDHERKRAQSEALRATATSTRADRGRAQEDTLARYLRLQAQRRHRRQQLSNENTSSTDGK